ncbi:hypothetical protein IWQ57_006305 [Coemansia nantahalensis]|uniref:Uncharacterized protein n=1 Tax=Coemansia nantahalensis TaxID=2789366 RepID=A0ACC1JK10_9FUNG|nr:hypothetical protein IWQ57_006305 [Coemansia nantahalensis]
MSIGDLKQSLAQAMQIPRERIRLMLDNVILDDGRTLEDYGIDGGSVLRLVRLARGEENRPRNVSGIVNASEPPPSPFQAFNNQARQVGSAPMHASGTEELANARADTRDWRRRPWWLSSD